MVIGDCMQRRFLNLKLSVFKNALKLRNLHLIHTSEKCLVKPGLTELNSEAKNWKTEFSIGFKKSLTC